MKFLNSIFLILLSGVDAIGQGTSIKEEKFVDIGGIEQWITIQGEDNTRPVVLFIHGGPGSVMSPYTDAIYGEWGKDFILINWDQRGAGRTFGRNAPTEVTEDYWIENPLTVAQMVEDGIGVAEYLIKYLGKQKVILIGTSWGSILGAKMALAKPDLFYAYIGHAQFVNFSENMAYAYNKVYEMAQKNTDTTSMQQLETLGKPPYDNAKFTGQFLRIVKQYEQKNSVPAPDHWWSLAPEYDNEKDNTDRYNGDDYSFIYFAGHKNLGIKSMVSDIDFNKEGLAFKIPVYLVQGEQDILTAKEINKPYFDKIKAPKKEYFLLPGAGHGHNQSVVDQQFQILKKNLSL
jgi:pimeloyl-ACP methyl ester carboxylesterase